ncbi:protein CASC3 [Lampris incognitus]|uniref:protein CASC3 n=1 Tax=Lampris incognitus TaxID=2546036 RepID=UPI0024B4AF1D|nr:protein CASC3 [Lampris incognitus]XP_056143407.1 protein CASC3 [Lampris incognitus]
MADRRRRRRRASQDSEEDDESGSGSEGGMPGSPATKDRIRDPEPAEAASVRAPAKSDVESECESEDGVGEAVLSDYESADPEENGSHSEAGDEEEEGEHYSEEEAPAVASKAKASAVQGPTQGEEEEEEVVVVVVEEEEEGRRSKEEGKTKEKGNLAGERQSGDGQESTDDPETKPGGKPGQKLDDDEDRKNPAYIPRKGLFFEHDVRGHAQEDERPKGRNRKLWKDEGRWEHDRFREEEQAPKSREELIAIYGYDIRNGGGPGERPYRQRRPRYSTSPGRDKRWREGGGGERPVRSWQSGGGGPSRGSVPPPSFTHSSSSSHSPLTASSSQRNNHSYTPSNRLPPSHHPPPNRSFQSSRPSQNQAQSQYRNNESNAPQHPRERQGSKTQSEAAHSHRQGFALVEGERGGVNREVRGGRGGPPLVVEEISCHQGDLDEEESGVTNTTTEVSLTAQPGACQSVSPQQQQEHRGRATRSRPALASSFTVDSSPQSSSTNREVSPPAERPVERKSYSLARRTRSRPADLGSKQPSVEETAAVGSASSPGVTGGKSWMGSDGSNQVVGGSGLTGLDSDMARLNLGGQNWTQNPTTYLRSEMRGLPNPMHMPSGPPQFSGMEEMGVGANRAKRYSSQRQRAVPEPTPTMHLGVMEGHYYDTMSYQGPIYAHGDSATPIPPQGMLVQPEMHIPHPGLHPHQSGAPMANPAIYGGPPVSLSPGQPQQLLAPPFYPPPGVMTFPYPAMYPNPQAQSQVYGGVTYYDTVQQQAQPKPSPPRRSSQPVTVKPPPPEVPFASE